MDYEKFIILKVKKVDFVRIRDIMKQHYTRRKITEQPKKVSILAIGNKMELV